jgi:hypothetical protein
LQSALKHFRADFEAAIAKAAVGAPSGAIPSAATVAPEGAPTGVIGKAA